MLYIHNHPKSAGIVTQLEFSKGMVVNYEVGKCINAPNVVIMRGLDAIINGIEYSLLSSNCHQFTNNACYDRHYSPAVHTLKNLALLGVLFKVGTSFNNKRKRTQCRC